MVEQTRRVFGQSASGTITQRLLAAALMDASPGEADYRLALRELSSHRIEALGVLRRHSDWGTPNFCSKCSPAGLGYCRCEIACNE
jgi:hypothetical protein